VVKRVRISLYSVYSQTSANVELMPKTPPIDRFVTKVKWVDRGYSSTCLEWTRGQNGAGYGKFWDGERENTPHKWFFEFCFGVVPRRNKQGKLLHLDHLCRNRLCCHPGHLQIVTLAENSLRGEAPTVKAHLANRCLKDLHDLPENLGTGRNRCRDCNAEWYQQTKRAAQEQIAAGTFENHGRKGYAFGCRCDICCTAEENYYDKRNGKRPTPRQRAPQATQEPLSAGI
jgi:hypothetical protein